MQVRLGYACISLTINKSASKTVTYTNYQKKGYGNKKIKEVLKQNLEELKEILIYNYKNDIHFYRLTSNLVPLATHPNVNFAYDKLYLKKWQELKRLIKKYEMRIDTHPDPFLVLNSKNPVVLKNSINVLNHHQQIFKLLGVKGKMVLHIGSGVDDKKAAMQRFVENFQKLNETIKSMIIIENDDKVFNVLDTLNLAKKLKVPMVLDYHHYKCHNNQEDIKDYLLDILNTWGTERPKMHFSSPKNLKEKRSHAEYIDVNEFIKFLEILKPFNRDIDIMLECKGKDMALFKLVCELRYKTNYTFIDNTTFII